MPLSPAAVACLFVPATVGLLYQATQPHPWPHRLLAIALMLISLEQAHMARVDLRQVEQVGRRSPDARLGAFRRLVTATVGGQVLGFTAAALGYLGAGMAIILFSLVGFNLGASVRLESSSAVTVQGATWRSRLDVLSIDAIALLLTGLWLAQVARPWVASLLFAIALLYALSKLWAYAQGRSSVHVAHAAQEHPQTPQQN